MKGRRWKEFLLFLSILGPGLVTANADNDAGGITTYATIGASYGYELLWALLLITVSLSVIQEISARMGVVTGKGLSDLIREEFGVKWTFFAMSILLAANTSVAIAEFAGIAASLEILGISKIISVPAAAAVIWLLVVKGSYRAVERAFLALSLIFATYIISGFMAKPDWGSVLHYTITPAFSWEPRFILLFIGMIGTTITPWMQFYLQSSVVDKGITKKHYKYERADVFFGAFVTDFVAFFIIVATAAVLHPEGISVESAEHAALALRPIAGRYASGLFALGLFGASFLAAGIIPLSTAYAICEAFGWESSINRSYREAPVFFSLFTFLIAFSAVIVLIPGISLIKIMLLSQNLNGILVPVILIFMLKLVNNKELMGDYTNSKIYNILSWATVAAIIVLTVMLLVLSVIRF